MGRIETQMVDLPNQKPGTKGAVVTLSGKPKCKDYDGPAPCPINPETGMHQDYWVLSDEERAKGFVKPVRTSYIHVRCGVKTSMNIKLAETYAANPWFYSGTFCAACREHFSLDQFRWVNNNGTDGEMMDDRMTPEQKAEAKKLQDDDTK